MSDSREGFASELPAQLLPMPQLCCHRSKAAFQAASAAAALVLTAEIGMAPFSAEGNSACSVRTVLVGLSVVTLDHEALACVAWISEA
jgi:hypothetical protein